MNKKFTSKTILILTSLLLSFALISCTKTDKDTILSPDVSEDIKIEENEIKLTLEKAHRQLNSLDFSNAKANYEKAISMAKTNKDIYLEIKDKYVSINRLDDAIYILQLAIDNNTDVENMKSILTDIKSKFEVYTFSTTVYEGEPYALPSESILKINNEDTSIPINWNGAIPDTSAPGTFTFNGVNDQYYRNFTATLTILPNVYSKNVCFIKNIYTLNGKTFIDVDLAEFYRGDIALEEAIKDNSSHITKDEDSGKLFIPNGYYIRNTYTDVLTYELSEDVAFNLLSYEVTTNNKIDFIPVSYDKFSSHINRFNTNFDSDNPKNHNRDLLFWIKDKNNIVYDISRQYTP